MRVELTEKNEAAVRELAEENERSVKDVVNALLMLGRIMSKVPTEVQDELAVSVAGEVV